METDGIVITESHLRSLIKAVSWRIWGTLISIIVTYLLTNELHVAIAVGAIEFFSKIILFYTHERIWDFITWGMHARKVSKYELGRYTKTNNKDHRNSK